MLDLRRFESRDLPQVLNLHRLAMERIGVYKGDGPWDDDLRQIEGVYLCNGGEFLVGEADGRLVAMGAFKRSHDGLAELKRMRVHPDCQGKGFGQLVYAELEKRAEELGYAGFHLETSVQQIAAQKLYLKCGFREAGRARIDGFDCILFEKRFGGVNP